MRGVVKTGQRCGRCGRDRWRVYAGFNRCACGQVLWLVRVIEPWRVSRTGKVEPATRFRYRQGPSRPAGSAAWSKVTQ